MAKQKAVKSIKKHEMIDVKTEELLSPPSLPNVTSSRNRTLLLFVLAIVLTFLFSGGLPVVALVNGKPIFRFQLVKALEDRFAKQTLEGMISEELVQNAANSANITITKEEMDAKIAEITQSLGGNVGIDDLLKFQGLTRADFEKQLRLQMTVEKVLTKDVTITEGDIDGFIATNSASLTATEPAQLRTEARQAIVSQKVSERLQPWFNELKENAKIWRLF